MATSTSTTTVVLIGDLAVQVPAGTPHTLNYATMDQHCRMLLARQPHWVTETELFQDSNYGFYPKSWTLAQISADFSARFQVIQGADLLYFAQRAAAVATTTSSTPATPTPPPTPTPAASTPPAATASVTTSPSITSASESSADTASIASKSSADSASTSETLNNDAPPAQPEELTNPPPKMPPLEPVTNAKAVQEKGAVMPLDKSALPALASGGQVFVLPTRLVVGLVFAQQHALQRQKRKQEGVVGRVKRFLSRLVAC